ncbi:MAG: metalloregulator ArsR/SmtB family transcription factor [Caulobacterales bacterium]
MVKQSAAALDQMFYALSDPTRRKIIERLAKGPASVSELAKPLPMSLPGVVQHLNVLEQSGVVISFKQGRVRTCRIAPKKLDAAQKWLAAQQKIWEARFDRFDALVMEMDDE